ncbi:MAG: hypothetical protein ACYCUV_13845 [Phycisphaerae bacterium]
MDSVTSEQRCRRPKEPARMLKLFFRDAQAAKEMAPEHLRVIYLFPEIVYLSQSDEPLKEAP